MYEYIVLYGEYKCQWRSMEVGEIIIIIVSWYNNNNNNNNNNNKNSNKEYTWSKIITRMRIFQRVVVIIVIVVYSRDLWNFLSFEFLLQVGVI